jgi:hypothetical protein
MLDLMLLVLEICQVTWAGTIAQLLSIPNGRGKQSPRDAHAVLNALIDASIIARSLSSQSLLRALGKDNE